MCLLTDMLDVHMLQDAQVLQRDLAARLCAFISPFKYTNDAMGMHDWQHEHHCSF